MAGLLSHWVIWALLSAVFAASTAILAKIGIAGLDSNLATFIRTTVVLGALALILAFTGAWRSLPDVSGRAALFLVLSGLATGASWLCYFRALQLGQAAQVAPIDKLSVVLVALFGATLLGEKLSPANWAGVALIAGGAILAALP